MESSSRGHKKMHILDLNDYALLQIFEYCDDKDLEMLYDVCKRFRFLVDHGIYYIKSLNLPLTGHNQGSLSCERTSCSLSYCDRMKIYNNWINGRYTEKIYFNHNKFYPSKIYLDNEHFYMTHTGMLRIHKRATKYDDPIERRIFKEIGTPIKPDIVDFKKKDNFIFAGRTCGKCFIYDVEDNDLIVEEQKVHNTDEYLMSVTFSMQFFFTSSDKKSKLWRKTLELGLIDFELMKEYDGLNLKCLDILPNIDKVIGGKYLDTNRTALREIDIETGTMEILNSNTLSIYDIKHLDNNIILTGHFDTTFRLFDRRTGKDESIWMDPYDSSIYCLEHDGLYAVLCGMKHNCRVNLYDIRIQRKFIQMYFPLIRKNQGSPVYSLTCDCRYLFLANDHNLHVWDFKSSWANSRDYRNVFVNV